MSSKFTEEELAAFLQSDHGTAPAAEKCGPPNPRPKPPEDFSAPIAGEPSLRWVNPKHKGPPRPSIDCKYPRVRIIQAKADRNMYSVQIKEKWWGWLGWLDWGIQKYPVHHPFRWYQYADALREARRYRWEYHHPEGTISFCKEVR